VQTYAEHEEDDAELGELLGQRLVGDPARREWSNDHAGQQIADERRDSGSLGNQAQHEREAEAYDDRGDEGRAVWHQGRVEGALIGGRKGASAARPTIRNIMAPMTSIDNATASTIRTIPRSIGPPGC
jgi:hypothetical protein